jgi:hypothetical protein
LTNLALFGLFRLRKLRAKVKKSEDGIMARDGRFGKLGPRDWPGLLRRMIPAAVWQVFLAGVAASGDPRTRWSPKYVLLCWVAMGCSLQRQLTERFREGRALVVALFVGRRRPGASYQGLTKAAQRLGRDLFWRFWCCLRRRLAGTLRSGWTWYGWVVLAVDGSRIEAPRTRKNERKLGRAGRDKTTPQWWVTWLIQLPGKVIWDWRQGPGTSSERTHLRQMLRDLPAGTLVVGDAGFVGFDLLWRLVQAGVDVLVRCASGTTLLADAPPAQIETRGEHGTVYLWPKNRRRKLPLRLRLILLKRGGKRVYLLTNVLQPTRLSRKTAGELYAARWGVETSYRALKQTLDRRRVLAKTPNIGEQELAANILALALLLFQAAVLLHARVQTLSVAVALRLTQRALEATRWRQPTGWFVTALRSAVRDSYHRRHPKRARDWPHKKNDPPPGPPHLRTPTPREKTILYAVDLYYDLKLG